MNHSIDGATAFGYGLLAGASKLVAAGFLFAALAVPAMAEVRIAALGDSLTQGFGLPEEQGFVPQLEAWLAENGAEDVSVINAGVSGDTTAGGRARVAWVLGDAPDAAIVALGGNDLLRGIEPSNTRENLDAILSELEEAGVPVLLAGLPAPANFGPEYANNFNAIFPALAEEYGAILYPNFLGGISDSLEDARRRGLMQEDGIHPNAEGVRLMVEDIGPYVLDLVALAAD